MYDSLEILNISNLDENHKGLEYYLNKTFNASVSGPTSTHTSFEFEIKSLMTYGTG